MAQTRCSAEALHCEVLVLLTGNLAIIAVVATHQVGYPASIALAAVLLVVLSVLLSRMGASFSTLEAEKQLAQISDRLVKETDDPDEPARWVP